MTLRSTMLAIISEMVLWGAILLVLFGAGYLAMHWGHKAPESNGQELALTFRDVSQLAVGSPVRFMGTDIGYVTKIVPHGHYVTVQFNTFRRTLHIPEGSHFTVEFNGLAGSKSLEILPPDDDELKQGPKGYHVEEPIRLRDLMQTQMVMAEALKRGADNIIRALGAVDEKVVLDRYQLLSQRLRDFDRSLVHAVEVLTYKGDSIHQGISNATGVIQSVNMAIQGAFVVTNVSYFHTDASASIRYFSTASESLYEQLDAMIAQAVLETQRQSVVSVERTMQRFNMNKETSMGSVIETLVDTNQFLSGAIQAFERAGPRLDATHIQQWLNQLEGRVNTWSEQSERFGPRRKKKGNP